MVKITTQKCSCGRSIPRIWPQGRTDDRVILAGAIKFYPTQQIEEVLKEFSNVTTFWQLIVSNNGKQDVIKILLEAEKEASGKGLETKIGKKLVQNSPDLSEGVNTDNVIAMPEIKLIPMGSLERKRGKIKDKIVDQRKPC